MGTMRTVGTVGRWSVRMPRGVHVRRMRTLHSRMLHMRGTLLHRVPWAVRTVLWRHSHPSRILTRTWGAYRSRRPRMSRIRRSRTYRRLLLLLLLLLLLWSMSSSRRCRVCRS